jgi:hypothetical protein
MYMRFGRGAHDKPLFSAYLPEAAFWALQADLKSGRMKYVEANFTKPRHGDGELTALYFSESPPE